MYIHYIMNFRKVNFLFFMIYAEHMLSLTHRFSFVEIFFWQEFVEVLCLPFFFS